MKPLNRDGVFIIAELSANHNHDLSLAHETIRAAKRAGADAVKLQTYTADTITIDCDNEYFRIKQGTLWDGTTLYKLYQQAYTPWEWHAELKRTAEDEGLVFFSTPFDKTSADFLETLEVPIFKIASFEITDLPLIEYVAAKGKPVLISTGIASLGEIQDALDACARAGNKDVVLLKCTSAYPAPVDEANLRTIPNMRETFGVPAGLSDHTLGSSVAVAAVALGAEVIEKHFILDRKRGGPDAAFSMEPEEFGFMVRSIRETERALGRVTYELDAKVIKNRVFSRSLFVVRDMEEGELFSGENIRSIRPGHGLKPEYAPRIIGRRAKRKLKKGTPLTWDLIGQPLDSHFSHEQVSEISEQFIINQIIGLLDAGVDVRVLSVHKPSSIKKHSSVDKYGLESRTLFMGVPDPFLLRVLKALPIAFMLLFTAPGLLVKSFNKRYTTAALSLKLVFLLAKLRKEKIGLLHTHFGPNGLLGAFLKDAGIADRLVATFHGSDINKYPKKHGRGVYARLFQAGDLITANTLFTKERLVEHGCPAEKIEILPVGLLCSSYPYSERADDGKRPLVLLTVGRLVEKKGHVYVIEALSLLEGMGRRLTYVIAGDGPLRGELEALVDARGLRDRVAFTGLVHSGEVSALYRNADLFILTSVTAADGDMEGQGLVLQEAQATGLPVISTLHNGIPDGVLDGVSGLLVPERDAAAAARAISRLSGDPDLRLSMGKAGSEFVRKNYDIAKLTDKVKNYYTGVQEGRV